MMPKPSIAMASIRLIRCWPLYTTGAPWKSRNLYLPDSLPNAITEPENVIAPTNVPMNSSMRLPYGRKPSIGTSGLTRPNAAGSDTTAYAMHTAARPISECIAATSSGIFVISTRAATNAPIAPPTTSPNSSKPSPRPRLEPSTAACFEISASVVRIAIAIPTMPKVLPTRAVFGFDSPLSAWMKHTDAIR
ncbi:hypothetical protein LMG27177_06904 [Paraburkholderia fynbosensis]|uniref:Uncharacterized protein n=1 Tax=Paraburkholderia fynbosensis TaxID=1200993 RepID=A0A6J5H389_9BURK|nr:hypothetical protein LMG27177_06904 [Paraburkholderia fynbosensis]